MYNSYLIKLPLQGCEGNLNEFFFFFYTREKDCFIFGKNYLSAVLESSLCFTTGVLQTIAMQQQTLTDTASVKI